MDTPDTGWPEWVRYTLTSLGTAMLTLIAVVKAWTGLRRDADEAKAMGEANAKTNEAQAVRIGALEVAVGAAEATAEARHESVMNRLDEIVRRLK